MTGTALDDARRRDRSDPLARHRDAFHLPPETVYLCGHSLGAQPKRAQAAVIEELEDWRRLAVKGHREARRPWMPYHELLAEKGARIVGARPDEVVHMNTLTANLHFLMLSFYRPTPERHKVVIEKHAFPSDQYAVASQIRFHGFDPKTSLIEVADSDEAEAVIEASGGELALVWIGGVNYYSGEAFRMESITRLAHAHDVPVGFDLAHAAGNVSLALHDWDVDFACWCTYKYLNGGPGSVGAAFVHERHAHRTDLPRLAGWWGHDKKTRFQMGPDFVPIPGAEGWQVSNPPILSLAPVLASLEMFDEVGLDALREKSVALTGYLERSLTESLPAAVEILTPRDADRRGAQLSLRIRGGSGREVFDRLSASGVVCDWREPDVIRVAPVPFYNSYEDACRFVEALARAISG